MDIGDKIIKNTGANAVGKFFDIAMLIITTPLIYRYLGSQLYGLWSLVFVLTGYITFFDFGIRQSYAKFIAEYHAKNDNLTINKILSTGLFFYFFIGIVATLLLYVNLNTIVFRLFKIPFEYGEIAKASILLAFCSMCSANAFACFSGLLDGLQRMELRNAILVLTRIISFLGILLVIRNDWGVLGLTINAAIRLLVSVILWIIAGIKIFPGLKISLFLISKQLFRKLFNYGYKVQVVLISRFILVSFSQMVLSSVLGLAYVGYYTIGFKVAQAVRMVPIFLSSALIPAVSHLNVRMRKDLIDKIYYKGSKYSFFVISWIFFGSSTVIPYIFYLWLGTQNPEISYTFYVMVISAAISMALMGVAPSILRGIGIVEYEMYGAIIRSLIIIPLGIVFTKTFGLIGLLLAIFIGIMASSIYVCVKFNKFYNTKPLALLKKITLFPLLLGGTLCIGLKWIVLEFGLSSASKALNVFYFTILSLIFSLIYISFTLLSNYFTSEEINYLKDRIKRWRAR
ncbi:MAG: oligosaccharide flippase family protein [Omnitrophica bacterium]|nr:oligosaccharide flippase family protein [Candidatus Omnitrophota bacterium]